jgi:UDP-MurNAc hydroxylase
MHVTFLGHAGLLVNAAGNRFLFDPWFAEPVFGNAWWRYPPAPYPDAASLPGIDVLVLSHIHPDHSGPGTLAQIDPATPTLGLDFGTDRLPRRLRNAGYSDVRMVPAWEPVEIDGARLTFVPHHAGWEVASIVIECEGIRLYHGNDNPLSIPAYQEIVDRLGAIDIAFLPFAGASSYPTCFDWDRSTIEAKGAEKKVQGIRRLTNGIEGLRPSRAVPFASSWALLEQEHLWRNYVDRPTAAEAAAGAAELAERHDTEVMLMQPGDQWSLSEGLVHQHMVDEWPPTAEAIARYAATRADDIAAAVEARRKAAGYTPDAGRLDQAVHAYFAAMFEAMGHLLGDLDMVAGFEASGEGGGRWHVVFASDQVPVLGRGPGEGEDEILTLPAEEMWAILCSEQNWEDPWYGYRLRVHKREGAGYYRAFWEMLLGFDDEETSLDLHRRLS